MNDYVVNEPDPDDSGKACEGQEHAFSKRFKCDSPNCNTILCRKCMGFYGTSGQRYCVLCALSVKIDEGADEWEYIEDEPNNGKKIGNFVSTFSVKADKETGKVIGWDQFFNYIDQSKVADSGLKDITQKLEKKMQATFKVQEVKENHYYILNQNTKQIHDVTLVNKNGQGEFQNLPAQLNAFLFNFTGKDILEDTMDVLHCVITMYDSKGDG